MLSSRLTQQHLKITNHLKDRIYSGNLAPGDQLPSEAELCEKFATSRGPVRQAMATLRSEGIISSGRGRRSVVLNSHRAETFEAVLSVSSWFESMGITPSQKTLWLARRPAPAKAAKALRLKEDDPIVFVHRIRSANGIPAIVERQYFPLEIGQQLLNFDADNGSVHSYLRQQGVEFDNVYRRMTVESASEEDARALGIDAGQPVFRVCFEIADHSGTALEYADNVYRTDQFEFALTNVRGGSSPLEVLFTADA